MTPRIAYVVSIGIIIVANALWYVAKVFIRSRGLESRWFSRHFTDFASLRQLASSADSPSDRSRARALLWALRASITAVLAVAFPLFVWGAPQYLWAQMPAE
jgi:hypothetical protein